MNFLIIVFRHFSVILGALLLLGMSDSALAQRAELRLVNQSARVLTIKVVQLQANGQDTLYSTLTVAPQSRNTEYFAQTGHYYLKVMAEMDGAETVFTKGNPFEVYVGADGYSVLTVTYNIRESNMANPMDGRRISKSEFEHN